MAIYYLKSTISIFTNNYGVLLLGAEGHHYVPWHRPEWSQSNINLYHWKVHIVISTTGLLAC